MLRLRRAWPDGAPGTPADWLLGLQIALRRERPPEAAALARRLLASPATTDRPRLTAASALLATDNRRRPANSLGRPSRVWRPGTNRPNRSMPS